MALLAKGQITIIDQQDGKSSYTHIRYSNDGVNFTPASPEALDKVCPNLIAHASQILATGWWDEETGKYTANIAGQIVRARGQWIPIFAGETYKGENISPSSVEITLLTYDKDRNFIRKVGSYREAEFTFTAQEGEAFVNFNIVRYNDEATGFTPNEASTHFVAFYNVKARRTGVNLFGYKRKLSIGIGWGTSSIDYVNREITMTFTSPTSQQLRVMRLGSIRFVYGIRKRYKVCGYIKANKESSVIGKALVMYLNGNTSVWISRPKYSTEYQYFEFYSNIANNHSGYPYYSLLDIQVLEVGDIISLKDLQFMEGEVLPESPINAEDAAIGTTSGDYQGVLVSDSPIASTNFSDYTWTKIKGEAGEDGRGVAEIKTQFAKSSSNITIPQGDWGYDIPNWQANTYLWSRMEVIYSNGHTSYTDAVLVHDWGAKDIADAAKAKADEAKARAEDTYTKAIADGIITAVEERAIWRSRAEALRTQVEYDKARLAAEYAKVRPQSHIVGELATNLQQKSEQFRGAADTLISACQSAIKHSSLTESIYNSLIINSNKKKAYDDAMDAFVVALAEAVELAETGGRNFFGFRKGIQTFSSNNVEITFESALNGIRIRAITDCSQPILARLYKLGFERAGIYTASFRVKSNRALAADALNVNICDAGLKFFTPTTTAQRVVTTAAVTQYYQANDHNGFIDFELSSGHSLKAGDVIEISDLMIERGRIPSDYKMAEEDATYMQRLLEDTLQLEEVTIGSSKGVSYSGRFDACEKVNGQQVVRSFLNGLTNGTRPAFAAGVEAFGETDERYSTALYHNGSGHLGGLNFSKSKQTDKPLLYVADGNGVERVNFSGEAMPTIEQLASRATEIGTIPVTTLSVSAHNNTGYFDAAQATASPSFRTKRATGTLRCRFRLTKSGTNHAPCTLTLVLRRKGDHYRQYVMTLGQITPGVTTSEFNIDKLVNLAPEEEYDLALVLSGFNAFNATGTLTMLSPLTYTQTNQDPFVGIFADGLMAYHSPQQWTRVQNGVVESSNDNPIVLASGYVDANGQLYRGKGRVTDVVRRSTGEYLIHHTIGHTDYAIVISPIGNGDLLVGQLAASSNNLAWCYIKNIEKKNVNGVSTMTNSAFTFAIIGRQ